MKTTLIIMAAGIGSRFGTGIKQLARMSENGEIIMDYSIHDAQEAGFDRVVFVIRKAIEEEFRAVIGNRIEQQIAVDYAFQELCDLPEGFSVPDGRSKPWGTGHAILCCRELVKEPFVIINADDFYGKEAFRQLHGFLTAPQEQTTTLSMAMAGFILKNTLSENGAVTRGVCVTDTQHRLQKIVETTGIQSVNGALRCNNPEVQAFLTPETPVSMNMWAGFPDFLEVLQRGFTDFLASNDGDPLKREYLLPNIVADLLSQDKATVRVYETPDKWIGLTYREDVPLAQASFREMIRAGIYPEKLWN